jgi:hypothetical protein
MALINEINKGTVDSLNGMTMYRKVDGSKVFQTVFQFVDDNTMSETAHIVVNYIQFYRNSNGDIVDSLTEYKFYIVGNEATYPMASTWWSRLARTPVTATNGIMDEIEYTLNVLPQDVPNGYTLQNPNP